MAVRSGLKVKTYSTPMLTTRAQCGGRTSTRSHVRKALLTKLERMANTASPLPKPCPQAPFWKILYAWRCRLLSSTSSLIYGILCSPVRRIMSILVANRLLPPAHSHRLYFCRSRRRKCRRTCWTGSVFSFLHSIPIPKPVIIQNSFDHMTWGHSFVWTRSMTLQQMLSPAF